MRSLLPAADQHRETREGQRGRGRLGNGGGLSKQVGMRPGSDEMDGVGSGIHSIDQEPVRLDVALAVTPPEPGQLMVSAPLGEFF